MNRAEILATMDEASRVLYVRAETDADNELANRLLKAWTALSDMAERERHYYLVANSCMQALWRIRGVLNLMEDDGRVDSSEFPQDIGDAIRLVAHSVRQECAESEVKL